MTDPYGLKPEVVEKIQAVFARYEPIRSAVLYGSRAKGNYKNGSDIDLTLITEGDLPNNFLNSVKMSVDDLNLIYTFDISLYHQIDNKNLLDHIERVGLEFYNAQEYKQ